MRSYGLARLLSKSIFLIFLISCGIFTILGSGGGGSDSADDVDEGSNAPSFRFLSKPFIGNYKPWQWVDHEYPMWPIVKNGTIVTYWGERSSTIGYDGHVGTDYKMPIGTTLVAATSGEVIHAGFFEQDCSVFDDNWNVHEMSGQVAIQKIVNGVVYNIFYDHMSRVDVDQGDKVVAGQPIGLSGRTGCAGPFPHLHLNVSIVGKRGNWITVDPYGWQGSAEIPDDPWATHPKGAVSHYLWKEEP